MSAAYHRRSRFFEPMRSNRVRARRVGVTTAVVMVASLLSAVALPVAEAQSPAPTTHAPAVTEASDLPSALIAARLGQHRVEALSERTESSATYANEDGTQTIEQNTGPVRVRRGDAWLPVDLTLVRGADGSIRPKAHPRDLVLGAGGPASGLRDLASVKAGDGEVALQWRGPLPEPVLEADRATYRAVLPGIDLVVQATRTGFEEFAIVVARPAAALRLELPLRTRGIRADHRPDGSTDLRDAAGMIVGTIPTPDMHDATIDSAGGVPTRRAPVGRQVAALVDGLGLSLLPDMALLNDPATRYPVTIDPAVSISENFDTFTESDVSTDQSTNTEMRIGSYNGGSVKARSYLHFDVAALRKKQILSATLWMYESWSYSCAPRTWEVWDTALVSTGTRWSNQPPPYTRWASPTVTTGHDSGCNPGWISTPVQNLLQRWSDTSVTTGSMLLKAADENDSYAWKKFLTGEGGAVPHIDVTYNAPPSPAVGLEVSDRGDDRGATFTRSLTPTLSFRTADPEGNPVTAVFYVYDGETMIYDQSVPNVPSGSVATWKVPSGLLQNGHSYRFRATSFDGHDISDDGWLNIRSVRSNLNADVDICGLGNATKVQQWDPSNADCQRFFPYGTGGGYYQFKVRHSGQVLDNSGCQAANNNPVKTYDQVTDAAANDCQEWTINRLGATSGVYSFTVRNAGKNLDQACSTTHGTGLIIYDRLDNVCQQWTWVNAPANGATVQWLTFTTDTTTPGAPSVSSPTYPADSAWHGAAGQSGAFTFSPPSGSSDIAGYSYALDSNVTTDVTADVNTAQASVTITPATDGHHALTVRTRDRAGNLSGPVAFAFLVGRGGLAQPGDGLRTPRRVPLQVDAQPSLPWVKYVYRRGPGAAVEADIPTANMVRGDGSAVSPGFTAVTSGPLVWNAADTLGSAAGTVQVKAVLTADSAGNGAYVSQWSTVVVDPDASGATSDDIGPGSLNLLTGDYSLDGQDAEEFGLSVTRASSSRNPAIGYQTQRERLTANQQNVSTDTAGFVAGNAALARVTDRGHTGTDSLRVTSAGAGSDTFAAVEGDTGALRLGMKPGRSYRVSGWIYVAGSTGLSPADARGEQMVVLVRTGSGYATFTSGRPKAVDAWVPLTLDVTVPAGATEAVVRLYDGFAAGVNAPVYFDDLSVRELIAPFGPQWAAGTPAGASETDYTRLSFEPGTDNSVVRVEGSDGTPVWFTRASNGVFFPEVGSEDLTLTTDPAGYRLTELDGTVTVFSQQAGSSAYLVVSTTPPAQASTTRYAYQLDDDRVRVKRVIGPVEPGVGDCTTAVPARGCEALEYTWAPTTTATSTAFGDVGGQVSAVSAWSTDPATGNVGLIEVSHYAYDDRGRLREVWDPRSNPVLKIRYDYDDAGHIVALTPPGELPWHFDVAAAGASGDPNTGRLVRARRDTLRQASLDVTDGEIATTVVYGVPLTRGAGGPYDLDGTSVSGWGQDIAPTDATAVFGPETPAPVSTATAGSPGPDGYSAASVHYLDASGREVNTATPGRMIDSTSYDRFGNVVRQLDADDRAVALDPAGSATDLGLEQTDALARSNLLATTTLYSADGVDKLRETGPLHRGVLPDDPNTYYTSRLVTEWTYDEGKPDGAAYHLVTAETNYGLISGLAGQYDPRRTRYAYSPVIGGTSGWVIREPTSTTVNLRVPENATGAAAEALTSQVRYDDQGRAVESRKPGASGTDAATTLAVFWTAGTNAADSGCGARPEWAGQPCVTKAGGAITGADTARMPSTLPDKRVISYNRWGDPTQVRETVGSDTRTTGTAYDDVGRVSTVQIGSSNGTAIGQVSTSYDAASGEAVTTKFADGTTVTRTLDKLGRMARYTDADGGQTTTEFDRFGKPVKISDSTGASQTFTYDRNQEIRGYLTSMTDSVAGTFGFQYDRSGRLLRENLPGSVYMFESYDSSGTPFQRIWGVSYVEEERLIATSSQTVDWRGRVARADGPGSTQQYDYDTLGRLKRASVVSAASGTCGTHLYAYDNHANRLAKETRSAASGESTCPLDTAPVVGTEAHSYDSADRTTDAGYTYDRFGRITTLPGGINNSFYANDMVASQVQGDTRMNWTLDPTLRLRGFSTDKLVNNAWANASSSLNHYGDDSDSPRWITEDITQPSGVTRMLVGADGGLVATSGLVGGSTVLQLTDLHGDVMTTMKLAGTAVPPAGASYEGATVTVLDADEFGVPNPDTVGAASVRYGWLGADRRSAQTPAGSILMGVRLYQPGLGRFLSPDPEPGGSASAYDYCTADPVNCRDLDGRWGWGDVLGVVARVGEIAAWIPGPIGTIAAGVSAVAYAATGNWHKAGEMALVAAANLVGGGAAVKLGFAAARLGVRAARAAPRLPKLFRAASCAVRHSFLPETPVLLADGTTLPIDQIQVGDLVAATDPLSGLTMAAPVVDVIIGYAERDLVQLDVGDSPLPITATAGHPIWIIGKGWTEAGDIIAGDHVLAPDGTTPAIREVHDFGFIPNTLVYNLTIASVHTYAVVDANTPVVVHNCSSRSAYRAAKRAWGIPNSARPFEVYHGTRGRVERFSHPSHKHGVVLAKHHDPSHGGRGHWEAGIYKGRNAAGVPQHRGRGQYPKTRHVYR